MQQVTESIHVPEKVAVGMIMMGLKDSQGLRHGPWIHQHSAHFTDILTYEHGVLTSYMRYAGGSGASTVWKAPAPVLVPVSVPEPPEPQTPQTPQAPSEPKKTKESKDDGFQVVTRSRRKSSN